MHTTIEHAADHGRNIAPVMRRAPARVRQAIARARAAAGLPPVADLEFVDDANAADPGRPGVWVNGPNGTLVPAGSPGAEIGRRLPKASRNWSRLQARPPAAEHATRILLVVARGDATATAVGRALPETIAATAFGTAAELNRQRGWDLRNDHAGPRFAFAGDRLIAHDSPSGLIVEWLPEMRDSWEREAVRAIEAGRDQVSVGMRVVERRQTRLPHLCEFVTKAELQHVALLLDEGDTGCYPAARAMVFRNSRRGDAAELAGQITTLLERSRFHMQRCAIGRR